VVRVAGPTHATISALQASFGSPAAVRVTLTSGAGVPTGNVSLSVDGGAPQLLALSDGIAQFSIPGLALGSHTLSASYADQPSAPFTASSATGTLTVIEQPPAIISPLIATFREGSSGSYTITASGSPTIAFAASNLPSGLTLNASTGVISGTP